jgi:predicted secreted protein
VVEEAEGPRDRQGHETEQDRLMANDRQKILGAINREASQIKDPRARKKFLRAAVQTGIVESGLRNLSYGDADSQGWRQERGSLYKNPTNIKASVRRFREEFQQHYDPGEASYEVAAQVQRPAAQYRGRYKDVAGEAERILAGQPTAQAASSAAPAGPSYRTVPGKDMSADRQALRINYLSERGKPGALLELGAGLREAQDTPDRRVKVQGSPQQQPSSKSQGSTPNGLRAAIDGFDGLVGKYGAPITAKQEPGHASGGDHDPAVKGASARDIGGDEATREKIFKDLTRRLGVKGAVYKGADINVTKGGVRYQIISRDHGSGPHLHVGFRRAGK